MPSRRQADAALPVPPVAHVNDDTNNSSLRVENPDAGVQREPNTDREITFRIWCHQCQRFTCASTLDEEYLPPLCPACAESNFLELVPFRDTIAEFGLFSEGPVWTEYEQRRENRTRMPTFDQMIGDMIMRAMNGDGNVNFFDLDDRRFEAPLSENAKKEMLKRFTLNENRETDEEGKTKKKRKSRGGDENSTQCAVCLDEMKNGQEMCELKRCGHVFHNECVNEWFKTKNSCPVCRDVLETSATTSPRVTPALAAGRSRSRGFRNADQQRRR